MATENEYVNNLFEEIEMPNENETFNENNNEKLPIEIFQEIESELRYVLDDSDLDDETDGPKQFTQNIVETVKKISMVFYKMEKEKPFFIFLPEFLQHFWV